MDGITLSVLPRYLTVSSCSVEQGNDISRDVKFRATIYPDGTVVWAPGSRWMTSCSVDLYRFPFDTQTCWVQFISWQYGAEFLDFGLIPGFEVLTDQLSANEEWDLVNTSTRTRLIQQEVGHLPTVEFSLTLARKPLYYMMNLLVPAFTISLVSVLVFLLPVEGGEKVSLSITVLLSYTVVLLIVSDITPKSGVTTPLISKYISHAASDLGTCIGNIRGLDVH